MPITQQGAVTGSLADEGVVIFAPLSSDFTNTLTGASFDSTFLGGTSYTEGEVVQYIADGFIDTSTNAITDAAAYNTFYGNLNGAFGNYTSGPTEAYLFSGGQDIGPVTLPNGEGDGFGLASDPPASAAPEPSQAVVLALMALGLGSLILRAHRRRKTAD